MNNTTTQLQTNLQTAISKFKDGIHCGRGILMDNDEYRLGENEEFGNSHFAFTLEDDCFLEYGYDEDTQNMLNEWKEKNKGETFDVKYTISQFDDMKDVDGLIIANVRTGEVFDSYIFSHMELDENTWFCLTDKNAG